MPSGRKKQVNFTSNQSSGYVHPSLQKSDTLRSNSPFSAPPAPVTVNQRIEFSRRSQKSLVPPSSEALRRATHNLSARPVPAALNTVSIYRRVPGPPPPRSWIETESEHASPISGVSGWAGGPKSVADQDGVDLSYFPGADFPPRASLKHTSLVALASKFEDNVDLDHYYLSVLPVELKLILLSYISCSCLRSGKGIGLMGLRYLFATEAESGLSTSTGTEGLTRLDLGGSMGRSLSLRQLGRYWRTNESSDNHTQVEAWDDPGSLTILKSPLRFPSLTHLSLARPGPSTSWSDLLTFSRHLTALTHISLASWPKPQLPETDSPDWPSMTTTFSTSTSTTPQGRRRENTTWIIAMLSIFCRNTPSLRWLCLDNCQDWLYKMLLVETSTIAPFSRMVAGQDPGQRRHDGWTHSWHHLETICLKQDKMPRNIAMSELQSLFQNRGRSTFLPRPEAAVLSRYGIEEVKDPTKHEWLRNEEIALLFETHVRDLRRENRFKMCSVQHGWNKQELLDHGYDEQELFDHGF